MERASSTGKKGSLRQGLDARVSPAGQGAGHPGGGPHTECPPHWDQDRKYPGSAANHSKHAEKEHARLQNKVG